MSSLATQLAELARRRDLDEKIGAFLRARYEFTGDPRHRLRRQDVYRAVAKETGETDNNELRCRVADLVEALGAREIKPYNQRLFCKMREKEAALLPIKGPTGQRAVAALQRAWYARLARENMGVTPDGAPKRLKAYHVYRDEMNSHVFAKMQDHYWAMRRELEIWGLYAMEALSIADVAARTGATRATVDAVVTRFRAASDPPRPGDVEVGKLRAQGLTVRDIAARLGIKRNRVESAIERLSGHNTQRYETGQED